MTEFSTMDLPEQLMRSIETVGYKDPTPIQARAIPHALNGQDVLGLAQTGTGKTAAFGIPLIAQMLGYGRKPATKTVRGLILAPTRELANQISETIKGLTDGTPLKTGIVVGGVSINPQIARIARGTDILVATPGRLLDIIDRDALDLGSCDFLVLDEADQMLDLGFIHALRKIAALLPDKRQTMLFSATMPKQMNEIASAYLKSPVRIEVTPPGRPATKVEQSVHFIAKSEKLSLLKELLKENDGERTLVFGRTKHGMEKLMKTLNNAGFKAAAIHGNKSQGQRERALSAFKSGDVSVLVATDVAARGLDIPDVKFVYNYELPNVPDAYVHRIGRTARAGKEGKAVAFCSPEEIDELKAIQKTMKITIPVASGRPWENLEPGSKPGGKPGGARGGRRRGGGGAGGRGNGNPGSSEQKRPSRGRGAGAKSGGGRSSASKARASS